MEHLMNTENIIFESQKTELPVWKLKVTAGRLELDLLAFRQGNDLQIMFYGGKPHLGAIAIAEPGASAQCIVLPGHKEGPLAQEMADNLATALNCTVSVACGIHYDKINHDEIDLVLGCDDELCRKLLECLRG